MLVGFSSLWCISFVFFPISIFISQSHTHVLCFRIYSMCITFWMYRGAIVANKEVIWSIKNAPHFHSNKSIKVLAVKSKLCRLKRLRMREKCARKARIILLQEVFVHCRFTFSIMTRSTMQLNLIWYRWDSILFSSSIYVLLSSCFLLTLAMPPHYSNAYNNRVGYPTSAW